MQPDQVLSQLRDVGAAVGALLDMDAEILSIHIGPTSHPPTVRIMPCRVTRQLATRARPNPYSGEMNVAFAQVELAWVAPGPAEVDAPPRSLLFAAPQGGDASFGAALQEAGVAQAARMADTLARLEAEIADAARQAGVA